MAGTTWPLGLYIKMHCFSNTIIMYGRFHSINENSQYHIQLYLVPRHLVLHTAHAFCYRHDLRYRECRGDVSPSRFSFQLLA